jgi:hypothetical protein
LKAGADSVSPSTPIINFRRGIIIPNEKMANKIVRILKNKFNIA